MRCREVESMLALEDVDARLDRDGVREHLGSCATCAGLWPEVAMLVEAPLAGDRSAPRRKAAKVVAAGLAAAAIVGIALHEPARPSGAARTPAARPIEAAAPLQSGSSALSQTTVTFDRGQRYESRFTHEVWTAPTPSCLKNGGPGS